jgi:hypothetical protein
MSLHQIGASKGTFTNRIFYTDENGNLVERIVHDWNLAEQVAEACQEEAHLYRPHNRSEFRKVASITPDMAIKWAVEAGIGGWFGDEEFDAFIWKKVKEHSHLLSVPSTYRIK